MFDSRHGAGLSANKTVPSQPKQRHSGVGQGSRPRPWGDFI